MIHGLSLLMGSNVSRLVWLYKYILEIKVEILKKSILTKPYKKVEQKHKLDQKSNWRSS